MSAAVQTPDDLRRMADEQAATLNDATDPTYAAFLCLILYGAADELERRRGWDRNARLRQLLEGTAVNAPR